MSAPTAAQLQREFGSAKLEPDALAECQSLCQAFGLTASELFIRWQTLLINRHGGDVGTQPTRDRLLEVRGMLQQESDRRASQRPGSQAGHAPKLSRNKDRAHYDKNSVDGLLRGMVPGGGEKTPQSAKRVGLLRGGASVAQGRTMFSPASPSVFAEPSPSAIRYSSRANTGRTEDVLHAELPPFVPQEPRQAPSVRDICAGPDQAGSLSTGESDDDSDAAAGQAMAGPATAPRHPSRRMRYMFERAGARAETANRRIERMAIDVKAEYGIEALANPTYPHQDTVTAVGRIANINTSEGLAAAAPISSDTLFLETSRRLGNGRRIALDVRSTPSFSLFPGQIVAVEGKNLKGAEFSVTQFRPLPRLRHPRTGDSDGGSADPVEPFSAVIASGPYTLSDNLEYEPLRDLVDHAIAAGPDLVLLLGPFVCENHPMVKDGQIDLLPEEIFSVKISPHLARLREGVPQSAAVFLVPSPDELCHPYASFPQPPLGRDQLSQLGVPDGVGSLGNPAQIVINGVTLAVSSVDVLFHLVKEEVSRLPALSDRLPRLAWHLVEQRHFYPLATPPADFAGILASHDGKLRMQATPDVLIAPSQLRQFARAHDNVVVVNPGHSSKGLSGGTFAKLAVHAPGSVETPGPMLGDSGRLFPAELTSVEIVRI
ncbi:DNA-directed DNA polymerase alpha subunit pol12 [Coemansia biformis]|uniref:DNA polymerase alpha subunit B n=1 Tax=Coemansia biformis TaxID=1286918 RepID=A0A9W8D1G8_9FUNG|nr:DNA-directed DNA polymerase alpha subunit pol12 [Coemansia biformis]